MIANSLLSHPRSLAACAINSDPDLEEPVVCWGCYQKGEDGMRLKSLWASVDQMLWHWYRNTRNQRVKHGPGISCKLNITKFELALELLPVDLALWPLPMTEEGPQGYSEVFASMPRRPQSENLRTSLVFSHKRCRCLPFDSNSTSRTSTSSSHEYWRCFTDFLWSG